MDGSIVLGCGQRKRLLAVYRKESVRPQVRLRAHIILIILLLSEGYAWSLVAAVLFCSTATIARWKQRFESGGVEARRGPAGGAPGPVRDAAGELGGGPRRLGQGPHAAGLRVLLGYCRSRWCCATLALVLFDTHRVKVSVETVRRCLRGRAGRTWCGGGPARCSGPRTRGGGGSCARSGNC